ncbi:hypothetical protein FRC02_002600 [Tulasnella sp. 418]|nr:hypothetical protein FRC02_002600 [Tulasnella sp. 418]
MEVSQQANEQFVQSKDLGTPDNSCETGPELEKTLVNSTEPGPISSLLGEKNSNPSSTLLSIPTAMTTPTGVVKRKASQSLLKNTSDAKRPSTANGRQSGLHPSVATPFKSPLPINNASKPNLDTSVSTTRIPSSITATPVSKQITRLRPATPNKFAPHASASKPFKSPLLKSSSSVISGGSSKKAIADLQRRLQTLKHAYKIHTDTSKNSEKALIESIEKWKTVARDAAQELWSMIKSSEGGGFNDSIDQSVRSATASPSFSAFESNSDSWGWETPDEDVSSIQIEEHDGRDYEFDTFSPPSPSVIVADIKQRLKHRPAPRRETIHENNQEGSLPWIKGASSWEAYSSPEPELIASLRNPDGDSYPQNTSKTREWSLGAMLSQLGIPAESLGWNEEEGEFTGAR